MIVSQFPSISILDGGDCDLCVALVEDPSLIGNGFCDGGIYAISSCSLDGGDCDICADLVEDITLVGNGYCDFG